jgi:hypothetical protein
MNTKLFISLGSLSISILTSIPTQTLASAGRQIILVSDISVAKGEPILNPGPQTYTEPRSKKLSQNTRILGNGVPANVYNESRKREIERSDKARQPLGNGVPANVYNESRKREMERSDKARQPLGNGVPANVYNESRKREMERPPVVPPTKLPVPTRPCNPVEHVMGSAFCSRGW